jgi:hypothetical protein
MNTSDIKKYESKSVAQLLKIAQKHFNKFIRERDKEQHCINCGRFTTLQAGHFYPTSTHSHLRFDEDNVHGECLKCNYFNSQSHSYGYRINLEKKIGKSEFEQLELKSKMKSGKWDRFSLIEKIAIYKGKC